MELRSIYEDGQRIPDKCANIGVDGGKNTSPPLEWGGAPPETKSFALSIIDRYPAAKQFVHWLVIDVPPTVTSVGEGVSLTPRMPTPAKELNTNYGRPGYGGPRPPAGTGDHGYEAVVYALNVPHLGLPEAVMREEFEKALEGTVLDSAKLTGLYSQQDS